MAVHVGPRGAGHISRTGGFEPDALLALDFLAARYRVGAGSGATDDFADLPGLSVVRPSVGYAERSDGMLVPFAANVARITDKGLLVEEGRTNSVRNGAAGGAVVGVVGSGGSLPTNWSRSIIAGIAYEVVGTGLASNGQPYVDVRISGANGTGANVFPSVNVEAGSQIAAASGQLWTVSIYAALAGGSLAGVSSPSINAVENNGAGAYVANTTGPAPLTTALTRFSATGTMGAGAGFCTGGFVMTVANGASVDLTLRLSAPQIEQGAFPTSYIPTAGAAATRAPDAVGLTAGASLTPPFTAVMTYSIPNLDGVELRPMAIGDGTPLNRIELQRTGAGNAASGFMITGGANQAGPVLAASGKTGARRIRHAIRVRSTSWNIAADGVVGTESAAVTLPPTTQVLLYSPAAVRLNGYIEDVLLLGDTTNTQLQSLTQ